MKIPSRPLLVFISTILASSVSCQATVIFYQGFNYGATAGTLTTVGSADWTTSADYSADYNTTSLSYGSLATTGGSAQTISTWGNGQTKTATQDFADIDISSKTELWVSMLVQAPTAVTSSGSQVSFGYNIKRNSWGSSVNNTIGKAWSNNTAFVSNFPTVQNITAANYSTIGTTTMLVVVRLSQNAAGEIWVNPTIGGSTPVAGTGQALESGGNFTSINSISLSFLNQTMVFDELRIGDTFTDVTPTSSSIPEPSTYALLLGLGMLGLCLSRRKRQG